ncbi:hypothetical protein [Bacillus toyonensis]|uniref:hypothetical protein n=1 Tax=Bacillus toyonensis TaxID=155322 RepID=UPI000BF7491A|nr:hypothetical protein [Bacillus toyonensis]PFY25166.1 hypothetical protein COL44_15130 [Bacillus toyonensis]PHG44687.1 hypothetical protein COI57_22565 [Bacillus toyonensis]
MGGKEGSRGYLYQSIATVIGTVLDNKWKAVEVEPDTNNDKVDILWLYENKKKVVQVKSSENNISKADIIRWLKELIEDVSDAEEYKLMLIGNCTDATSRFVTKIKKKNFSEQDKDYEDLSEIKSYISKIEIQFDNFQLDALEAQIHQNVSRLLAKMGHVLHPSIIDQIAGAMVYQFSKFSTNGTRITREEYIERIQEWAYYNYPEIKGQGLVKKALEVAFYYKDKLDFSNKIRNIYVPISSSNPSSEKLKQSIKEIELYKLTSKSKEEADVQNNISEDEELVKIFGTEIKKFKYKEITDSEKEKFIRKIKELLGVEVENSFFYVGNLSTKKMMFSGNVEVKGTDEEKEKGKLLDSFLRKLYKYEQYYSYRKYIESLYLIPLVLRNNGQSYDEDIEVIIKIPSNVLVITQESIEIPNTTVIEEFTGEEGLLEYFLKHPRNYQLEEYLGYPRPISMRSHLHIPLDLYPPSTKEIKERKIERFNDYLEGIFNFEIYIEPNQTILQYYFRELNAKKNMAFPAFLMVKADETFHIEYEITSKHLGNKVIGELIYEIN